MNLLVAFRFRPVVRAKAEGGWHRRRQQCTTDKRACVEEMTNP